MPAQVPPVADEREGLQSVIEMYDEETAGHAGHAGHADIVRESVDGTTSYASTAAEGWPATPWVPPWEPKSVLR